MRTHHIVSQIQHHELRHNNVLHVVGCVSNPVRYHSRYRLARQWLEEMNSTPNVKAYMVECAFGDREFEVTEAGNPQHLQLRTKSEIWIKENLLNLGVRHLLPLDWKYLCWSDTDISFRSPHWPQESLHQLQHFEVIQPWSDCLDLGVDGNVMQHFKSFGSQHQKRIPKQMHPSQPYQYAHTGYAWACTRTFWEASMGLPDFCILGSADHHAAFACIGEVDNTIHKKMSPSFFRKLREWQMRAIRITHKEVGFNVGRIEHSFHGKKANRKYRERWDILIKDKYDPDEDLMYNSQGLIHLINNPKLEQDIKLYNRQRNEDSIDEY